MLLRDNMRPLFENWSAQRRTIIERDNIEWVDEALVFCLVRNGGVHTFPDGPLKQTPCRLHDGQTQHTAWLLLGRDVKVLGTLSSWGCRGDGGTAEAD